jgi:predicted nucleic acid-binding protein
MESGSFCTSRLTRLECRVKPLRENNAQLLDAYEQALSAANVMLIEIDAEVIDRAAEIRARLGFKTPDAIHLASAIRVSADKFVTADKQLSRCGDIKVDII